MLVCNLQSECREIEFQMNFYEFIWVFSFEIPILMNQTVDSDTNVKINFILFQTWTVHLWLKDNIRIRFKVLY